jgi:hypothetical protein
MIVREDLGRMYMLDFNKALFDSLVINVNVFGFDTCPNSFGACQIRRKLRANLIRNLGKE